MVNLAVIISASIIAALILFCVIVFMVYMQHPEDKYAAWGSKIVVLFGLFLACVTVLLIPFDVALKDTDSYSAMGDLWYACYIAIACMTFVINPFATQWYEADEDEPFFKKLGWAILWVVCCVFVFAVVTGVLYKTIGFVQLPISTSVSPMIPIDQPILMPATLTTDCSVSGYCTLNTILKLRTSIFVYILAMLSFFGWFLVMVFGGIGLFSLPMDLINAWRMRPTPIDIRQFSEKRVQLHTKTVQLVQVAKEKKAEWAMKKPGKRHQNKFCNKLKKELFCVEEEYENMQLCYKERGGNPIIPFFKLILGIFSIAISVSWIVQIILVIFLDECSGWCPFLNTIFVKLNNVFPLFGTVAYGVFAFYLLWAVIKGAMKFGMRFFLISIHPMKVGGTLMNSMLFNTSIILLCSASIVQLCATAFADYARLTAISQIFVSQVKYLIFLEYFYDKSIFYIIFIILAFITLLVGIIEPCVRKKKSGNLETRMKEVSKSK